MPNIYEERGRLVKATRIADILAANGYTSGTVAGFTTEQWSLASAAARYAHASPETQEMVVKMLRQREMTPRLADSEVEKVFDKWREDQHAR